MEKITTLVVLTAIKDAVADFPTPGVPVIKTLGLRRFDGSSSAIVVSFLLSDPDHAGANRWTKM